jgi:hypothetical protein
MFAASKSGSFEASDAQFNYVTMLLHGDGTNGAQNNTFVDSSTNAFSITRNGNPTQGTFTPYGANWSNYFDGSGDYINAVSANTANAMGTGDWTVECWVYKTNSTQGMIFDTLALTGGTTDAIRIYINASNAISFYKYSTALTTGGSVTLNTWNHVAVVRQSSEIKIYLNGTQVNTTYTDTGSNYTCGANRPSSGIDGYDNSSNPFQGYISNLRAVKGTAVYTSNFTPSTIPLTAITNTSLLTCQSNRFIDNSTNAFAITVNGDTSIQRFSPFSPTTAYSTSVIGGSGYFDGSGDYLSVASQTALGMGSGDFTYEAWIYVNEIVPTNALRGLFDSRVSGSTGCGIYTSADSGATSKLVYATNSAIAATSTNTIKPYCWTFVAVTRSSGTVRGFLNGVLEFTVTDSRTFSSSAPTYIGTDVSPQYFNGFINDARILKGTAQYTSAFTPNTAPLTAITNTSLLLNYTNAAIFDNAMMNDLETVGNAQISTSVKKYGAASMYFDGSGDGLNGVISPLFDFGSGSFTVEFWAYCVSTSGTGFFVSCWDNSGGSDANSSWLIRLDSGNVITHFMQGSGTYNTLTSTALSTNTWFHFAWVKNGTTQTMYINGTSVASGTVTGSMNAVIRSLKVGYQGAATNYLNGYIDDLRITKGVARYTANFSVPTAAFPNN